MLEKCQVGVLVNQSVSPSTSSLNSLISSTAASSLSAPKPVYAATEATTTTTNLTEENLRSSNRRKSLSKVEIPVLDSYQSAESVTIVIYTRCKMLQEDCLVIDKIAAAATSSADGQASIVLLHLYVIACVFKYSIEIPAAIKEDYESKRKDLLLFFFWGRLDFDYLCT